MATVNQVAGQFTVLLPKLMRGVRSDFLTAADVTSSQMVILMLLHDRGRSTVGAIARELKVSMPTITGLSERLVRRGYLKRSGDPDDRRLIILGLTKKGRAMVAKLLRAARQRWSEVLGGLSARERTAFLRILKKIIKGLP